MSSYAVTARTLRADQLAAEGADALSRRSIPSLLLRGPVIARWLYDSPSERDYIDADLLVPEARRHEALAALQGIGMSEVLAEAAESERSVHAQALKHVQGGMIDLHWTLIGVGAPPDAVWSALNRDAIDFELADGRLRAPGEAARALMVALHAAQHGPQGPRQLTDVERAIERVDLEVWRRAADLARELEALPAFAGGLRTAPRGEKLVDELSISAQPDRELALRAQGDVPMALGIERLRRARGLKEKLRLVVRELWPTASFMRRWSRLAQRGRAGMALARAWRPLWLLLRLPAAALAHWRIRSVGRSSAAER